MLTMRCAPCERPSCARCSRDRDAFGPTVNLVPAFVDIARWARSFTDPTTAAAIAAGEGYDGYELEEFPTADLRGFGPEPRRTCSQGQITFICSERASDRLA